MNRNRNRNRSRARDERHVEDGPRALCRIAVGVFLGATIVACAAKPAEPKAPESTAPASPSTPAGYPSEPSQTSQPGYPGYPQQAQPYPAPPPPPPSATMPGQPATPDTPASRAARDFDAAERELMVATSDCGNACRALGSMDRAAGNICKLSQDKPRCDDATSKVRSAREKVKNSCGDCKETSTNRNDPVPSR